MAKRYYWLKLKDDFFDDDTISYIEEQENGVLYVNFYLKLCLKSLKTEGKLIRLIGDIIIPYDVESLARLTRTPADTVRVAMTIFERIGLIKILETGEIYLSQINEMIGIETDKAAIMRRKRAEEKLAGNNVTEALPKCYTEIEIEKDTEGEIERDNKASAKPKTPAREPKHKYGEYNHVLLTDRDRDQLFDNYGESETLKAIKLLDEYIEETGKKYKNHYLTMTRWVFKALKEREHKIMNTLPDDWANA